MRTTGSTDLLTAAFRRGAWTGVTWFFSKEPVETKIAKVSATQANLLAEPDTLKRGDHAVVSIITDLQEGITNPNIREAVNGLVHSACQHMSFTCVLNQNQNAIPIKRCLSVVVAPTQ